MKSEDGLAKVSVGMPLISAVIPTLNRPQIVLRAVKSVLGQSYQNIEAIVVIDGVNPETEESLKTIDDPRLRVIAGTESVGGSEARNIGARAALGKWVAMLDDDDEWRPDKLEKQVGIAEAADNPYVLVFSTMIVRHPDHDVVLPRRLPGADEAMSDYLFIRRGLSFGDGFLQTSSFFASRQMFMEVPFRKGQQRFQDTDWLLRASAHPEAEVKVIDEPLVIYYMDLQQAVSRKADWEYLFRWARENRGLFTPKAYSYFISTQLVPRAATQKAPLVVFLRLLKACIFQGSADLNCLAVFSLFWLVPGSLRQRLRKARTKGLVVPHQPTVGAS